MNPFIIALEDADKTKTRFVGSKAANLGELTKLKGIKVPAGFCISTIAFRKMMDNTPSVTPLLGRLSLLGAADRDEIARLGRELRKQVEQSGIPAEIRDELRSWLAMFDQATAWAVRSSATAEDLPTASFAGQQDTYLNIIGEEALLRHISKCWASLFTDRAITYRIQNGIDHYQVSMAVIIQQLVSAEASGVMFTADPVSSNRKVISIDAAFGLGEALVSGRVNPDTYTINNGWISGRKIQNKQRVIRASRQGGTEEKELEPPIQNTAVLSDEQVLRLAGTGKEIAHYFGSPQDIEWCLAGNEFYIVQSRPVTSLYPIPGSDDGTNHVFISVGHQQMMTEPFRPLGLSIFKLTAGRPMYEAGGRLFVDVTPELASPARRNILMNVAGKSDALLRDGLNTILERPGFITTVQESGTGPASEHLKKTVSRPNFDVQIEHDPEIVSRLIQKSEGSIRHLKETIHTRSGVALFDFLFEDLDLLKKSLSDPETFAVIMTGLNAYNWLNEKIEEWLGEKNVADILTQSVSNNITSDMGRALLDVADVIRPYPELVNYLSVANKSHFFEDMEGIKGGSEAISAITNFLDKYGMRCAGEIDITRTRWSEDPAILIPVILGNIRNLEAGASRRKFEQGLQEARLKEEGVLIRLKQLPGADEKIQETKRKIELVRGFTGLREYPKYSMVSRYYIYKMELLQEAKRLVQATIIREPEDVYYLSLEEFRDVVQSNKIDYQIITRRKEDFKGYEKLKPPRIITSDGEIIRGEYRRQNVPAGAIMGLPVSAGVAEGRARVIFNIGEAKLEPGDILVTSFTDPSWTPLFVSIKGLVTEVGGLMTHGAVIAREYGLPAVVAVENATRLIKDGQRIRVRGTEGYIEFLD